MSAAIKGKQIRWGIDSSIITAAGTILTNAGIVQSFKLSKGGQTTYINDEDDDAVSRIDHDFENKITLDVIGVSATVPPAKGLEIVGATLGTIDGVDFTTGRTFIDSVDVDYTQGGATKISLAATHKPGMGADA
jgi:hypothetical protein